MKKQVLIADADEQFRNELVKAFDGNEEFEVVGVAVDGEETQKMLRTKRADYLVMDTLMPKIDGLTILEYLRHMWHRPKVLVTSEFISKYVAVTAMRMGAQQLLYKPCDVDLIIRNLQRMDRGEAGCPVVFLWNGKQNLETLVTSILHEIGVPASVKGYYYLREAIMIAANDMDVLNAMNNVLYAEVANRLQTTTKKVERAIRGAIEIAWDRGDLDTLQRFFGYTVSNTKGKPTNTEFISLIADQIRLWMKANPEQLK